MKFDALMEQLIPHYIGLVQASSRKTNGIALCTIWIASLLFPCMVNPMVHSIRGSEALVNGQALQPFCFVLSLVYALHSQLFLFLSRNSLLLHSVISSILQMRQNCLGGWNITVFVVLWTTIFERTLFVCCFRVQGQYHCKSFLSVYWVLLYTITFMYFLYTSVMWLAKRIILY